MALTWLGEPTVAALRDGLRMVAPELAGGTIVPRGLEPSDDPRWCAASAIVDEGFVVKFAWAEPPARRICREAEVLGALRAAVPGLPLPEVVAASRDPAMLVTRRVRAKPFFAVRHRIAPAARPAVARDLAAVLAQLHGAGLAAPAAVEPEPTAALRDRFGALVGSDRHERVVSWCDWADRVLARPGRRVLTHGDFHGDNHLWDAGTLRLRLVIDLETVGVGEPEYDLRCLPGDCGMELFLATVASYERVTGTALDVDRIMAWHLRTVLGDALWRGEAGVALPDHRTPGQWVDDLDARFLHLHRTAGRGTCGKGG
ncbi:hypothetical protein Ade02nite_80770 [Paractinoplanes deccanensis]|uniref:Aminoglycoside phosphotransferase domain-containing protein n=1 Tax=Paractinoplanes deccanensis TaxID=113561 RepID=A0ABQ3YHG8_9ACTN|nr:phosphotransferase [Actinoplanes deccanensis]GID79436.1 hypothetical protein Ade02nite_80770 [Actinoplanes deccanensis]